MGGLFGIASRQDCVKDLFYGTDYHSHLGTRRAGLAVVNEKGFTRSIHSIESSYFRSKFEPDLTIFQGNMGIGVISDTDSQPLIINSHLGTFGIVTVGKINNLVELGKLAFSQKKYFSETSGYDINPTELIAMLICEQDNFVNGIRHVNESVRGSCTILLLTRDGIYAARDRYGRTPIVIGRKDGALAASSESSAFPNLGYETEYYVGPAEIVHITPDGYEQVSTPVEKMQVCSFLWVYYGYPPSCYEGINVEEVRYRCGRALSRDDTVEVDFVSGIPDSGIGHALGYATGKGIPYMRPYVKYTPTWPRSFMPQNQSVRDLVAKMKLIPNRAIINGRRIVFCDDSIVRGTQLQDNIQILYEYGAREVHMRVACPTLIYPCEFLNFSSSRSQLDLAGRKAIKALEGKDDVHLEEYARAGSEKNRAMVEQIRKTLGMTSLKYQTIDDLVEAIGLPKERLCTHCWDGTSYC
ncbi:MAG TPA: amidophosphoribosyltransferase [Deltaproteobacteria bacterium]|nr:amidophosphoribosyltransferase [Deltaproteobacteria bacterium]OQC24797.1 MAG: Amidophosphoribosyltransferase precursor [Deltaproteobacteria bacterium ADurb.Bin072]HRW80878.1 amidophosphoribosyltransferase [Desulfomonilia bacterium]NMD40142.1 amidophosphoribosyltransferase [Deltaproteobacteria bacterium]HNQ85154.1 amidophosphoribosyltransferase [Deltaproteobacteria bacterium]